MHATDRPIQTRFRCAYTYRLKLAAYTKSLTHYTKGTPSGRHEAVTSRSPPTACRHPVSGSVSLPSSGCFSPFPHGTCSLSVTEEYLGLEGGPPTFRQGFTCPALLEDLCVHYPYGAITHSGAPFQTLPVLTQRPLAWSPFAPFGNPRIKACSRLPTAYRSVPRPSSPLGAKASTKCP
jgi:hypothetical protein